MENFQACVGCHSQLHPTAKFCMQCGHPVDINANTIEAQEPSRLLISPDGHAVNSGGNGYGAGGDQDHENVANFGIRKNNLASDVGYEESFTVCEYEAECQNMASGICSAKYCCFQRGCGRKICHEHQFFTLNSGNYQRYIVSALCIDCYPKMRKFKDQATNFTILGIILVLLILIAVV